jgi:hypothetical protein
METFYALGSLGAIIIAILLLVSPLIIVGRLGRIIKLLEIIANK